MKAHGWALKTPHGRIVESTFSTTRDQCWSYAFEELGRLIGREWVDDNWNRWRRSIRTAQELGYEMVKVRLIEVGP